MKAFLQFSLIVGIFLFHLPMPIIGLPIGEPEPESVSVKTWGDTGIPLDEKDTADAIIPGYYHKDSVISSIFEKDFDKPLDTLMADFRSWARTSYVKEMKNEPTDDELDAYMTDVSGMDPQNLHFVLIVLNSFFIVYYFGFLIVAGCCLYLILVYYDKKKNYVILSSRFKDNLLILNDHVRNSHTFERVDRYHC